MSSVFSDRSDYGSLDQYQLDQQLRKENEPDRQNAGSLREILGEWIGKNWTTMETRLAALPAHLRIWLLNYLSEKSLLVDPLLHTLAPDASATVLGSWLEISSA